MACPRRPHSADLSGSVVRSLPLRTRGRKVDGIHWAAALTGLPQSAEASLRLDAGRLDDARVLVDFAAHETGELLGGHVHRIVAEVAQSLAHAWIGERLARVRGDFRDDIRRRAGRRPDAEPQGRIRPRDPRFARGRNFRQLAVALRRAHGERPNPAAFEVRYRRGDRRPVAIHRPAQHRLDHLWRALERNLSDVDFGRRDELLRVEVRAAPYAGVTPVERTWLLLRRVDQIHQGLVGRSGVYHKDVRLNGERCNIDKILYRVVRQLRVDRRRYRVRVGIDEQRITVGCRFRHHV